MSTIIHDGLKKMLEYMSGIILNFCMPVIFLHVILAETWNCVV